jgi:hypothetical protein
VKYAFVEKNRRQYGVPALCEALQISRSGYYAARHRGPSARLQRQGDLTTRITLDTKLAMDALKMAIAHRGPPITLHSDQGSTYATGSYREIVNRYGIRQSMSRKGDCWDTQSTMALNVGPT